MLIPLREIELEITFIENGAVKSLARMLRDITNVEGRFDLTDSIKRSRTIEEFTEAVYNSVRVANTIRKQREGVFVHLPNENELEKVFVYARDPKLLPSLKNTIASYALSFPSRGEVSE